MKGLVTGFALLVMTFPSHTADAQSRTASFIEPGVDINISYDYYPVHGNTARRVAESLRESGPRSDGTVFYATTSSQTGFSYRRSERGTYCKLENVGVRTEVVMLLPQWLERDKSGSELQRAWDEFLDRLLAHEGEHYRIVDEASKRLYRALAGMRAKDCSMLDSQAKATIEEISEQQTELNHRFDEETSHGMNEGAIWPPESYRQDR